MKKNLSLEPAGTSRPGHWICLPAAALLLCAGCQFLNYSGPNGERFTRAVLGSKTAIGSLAIETGTNGLRRLELHGYENDNAQALGVVTEAAVRAALSAK